MVKRSTKVGLGFGLTSGIITTLGLMVGLSSSTNSQSVVVGGILTIAIADAFSDALGIHVSEESQNKYSTKAIWEATFITFFSKLVFASTFLVPVLLLPLNTAVWASIVYGFVLLGLYTYFTGRNNKEHGVWSIVFEHLAIATVVIIITSFVGQLISARF